MRKQIFINVASIQGAVMMVLLLNSAGWFLGWRNIVLADALVYLLAMLVFSIDLANRSVSKRQLQIATLFSLAYLLIYFPFRDHDQVMVHSLTPVVLFLALLCKVSVFQIALDLLTKALAVSAVISLAVFAFNLVGIDPPSLKIEQGFRRNDNDFYKLYGWSLQLSTQSMGIESGNFVRTSGLLKEPGHFGMFTAAVLVACNMEINTWAKKLTMLGGFLTFSPAFYGFLGLFYILNFSINREKLTRTTIILLAIGFVGYGIVVFGSDYMAGRLIGPFQALIMSGNIMQVLEVRTLGGFSDLFMSLELSERLIGLGSHFRESAAGFQNVVVSDWRGFVVKNGYISLVTLTAAFVLQL